MEKPPILDDDSDGDDGAVPADQPGSELSRGLSVGSSTSTSPSEYSEYSVDGGVRLAGGRPGSDVPQDAPYGYGPRRPTGALPPPYGSISGVRLDGLS